MLFSAMWRALENAAIYSTWQSFVGAERMRRTFVTDHLRPKLNEVIVDIGCGPAEIIDYLPPSRYFGFDINPAYIEAANARYSTRGKFSVLGVEEASISELRGEADLAIAIGVLHHLDNSAANDCISLAHSLLKPGGRFVTIDGVIHRGQGFIRRCVVSLDRGQYVRTAKSYRNLVEAHFPIIKERIYDNLARLPSSHFVMECTKEAVGGLKVDEI